MTALPPTLLLPVSAAPRGRTGLARLAGTLAAVAAFVGMLLAVRAQGEALQAALDGLGVLGMAVFAASSALAVLLPALSNLALVPVAVAAWGPGWTALLLLAGWVAGSLASYGIGRQCRGLLLARFPSLARHADIDRLLHPGHPLASLVLLRMSFPVDVLSYALGLFSRRTTAWQTAASTAIGGAPFALLFAGVPALPDALQLAVLAASVLAFVAYLRWVSVAGSKRSATPLLQ